MRKEELSTVGNHENYMRSLIFEDILSGGRNVSTEYYPLAGSFGVIGSKYKVSGVTSFQRMEDLLPNERKSLSPCCCYGSTEKAGRTTTRFCPAAHKM